MKTPRTVLVIDENHPGTEIAAETAAAMAASSIVFRRLDRPYARRLLNKAKSLFEFAKSHKGTFDGECPFYCSYSGYNDELLWAATWLFVATKKPMYYKFIKEEAISASVAEFSWDLKYAGVQVILSKVCEKDEAAALISAQAQIARSLTLVEYFNNKKSLAVIPFNANSHLQWRRPSFSAPCETPTSTTMEPQSGAAQSSMY